MNLRTKNCYALRCILNLKEDMWFGANFFLELFAVFIKSTLSYLIFRAIFLHSAKVDANEIALYYILVNVVSFTIVAGQYVAYSHMEDINTGAIISDLIRPYSYPLYNYFVFLSSVLIRLVVNMLLIWGVSTLLGYSIGIIQLLYGFVSTLLGFSILYMIQAIIGCTAVWFHDITRFRDVIYSLLLMLGGRLLPSDMLFGWIKKIVYYTPLPYIYDIPVKAFMGRAALTEMGVQLVWVIMLSGVYYYLFHRYVKHNIEFGG